MTNTPARSFIVRLPSLVRDLGYSSLTGAALAKIRDDAGKTYPAIRHLQYVAAGRVLSQPSVAKSMLDWINDGRLRANLSAVNENDEIDEFNCYLPDIGQKVSYLQYTSGPNSDIISELSSIAGYSLAVTNSILKKRLFPRRVCEEYCTAISSTYNCRAPSIAFVRQSSTGLSVPNPDTGLSEVIAKLA